MKTKPIIIIDGPDGVGKTTLAKNLQKTFNITSFIHLTKDDPRTFEFYKNMLFKKDAIFDRSFMSELIYSAVFERKPALTVDEFKELHNIAKVNGAIIIICVANTERERPIFHDNEDQRIIDSFDTINKYFFDLAKRYGYIVYYQLSNDQYKTDQSLLQIINDKIKELEQEETQTKGGGSN